MLINNANVCKNIKKKERKNKRKFHENMHDSRMQMLKMNKSFPQSPTASSETTSETQSINDEPITINRSLKQTKKIEKERPPWKPVSIAAPSKADKNALLKAKILDATRRALISQRIANTSTQTDPISTKDEQVETDGAVTIKKESPGGFILTQTIGLATDGILVNDRGTQTARPKTSLSFTRLPHRNTSENRSIYKSIDDEILKNAQVLQGQIDDIKKLDEQLWKNRSNLHFKATDTVSSETNEDNPDDPIVSRFSDDSLCENEQTGPRHDNRSLSNDSCDIANDCLDGPTLTSWIGFDSIDDDDYDLPALPRKTMSEGYAPWSNFKDVLIGNRLANMHLSPIPPRRSSYKRKSVTWSDSQHHAVSELISEASALLDVFDNVAMLLGPDLHTKQSPITQFESSKLSESKWQPILAESSMDLKERLQNFKPFKPHVFSKKIIVDDIEI